MKNEEFYMNECKKRWSDKDWCEKATQESKRREAIANNRKSNMKDDVVGQQHDNGCGNGTLFTF